MGLLTGYQDDAERLARQEKAANRAYNHDVRGLKAEAAPHEATVKDYNTQVEGFKASALSRPNDSVPGGTELWQIAGWVSANSGYPRAVAHQLALGGSKWFHGGAGNMYAGSFSDNSGGGWYWQDTDKATIRRAADGTPITDLPHNYGADQFYASWNDKPFIAPVTQAQIDAAKVSDTALSDIGARGEEIGSAHAAQQGLLKKKSDRMEGDIAMNQGAIANEIQLDQGGSVFDQTKVFQSITDWLKG